MEKLKINKQALRVRQELESLQEADTKKAFGGVGFGSPLRTAGYAEFK